jgi:hypothetical protein
VTAERRIRAALGLGLALALGLTVWIQGKAHEGAPPSLVPAVDNPGPAGLEAAYLYLKGRGQAQVLDAPYDRIPAEARLVLTALPYSREVPDGERLALWNWVLAGGTLVVLGQHNPGLGAVSPRLNPDFVALDLKQRDIGLSTLGDDVKALLAAATRPVQEEVVPGKPALADPLLSGVRTLALSARRGFDAAPGAMVPLAVAGDTPVAFEVQLGEGRVVALAGADALANDRLDLGDNLQLLANLGAQGPVWFDEFHHRPGVNEALEALSGVLGPPLAQLFLWLAVLGLWSSRRLGPVLPAPPVAARAQGAYAAQLGMLYRRARAEPELAAARYAQTRARLEARLRVPAGLDDEAALRLLRPLRPDLEAPFRALSKQRDLVNGEPSPETLLGLSRAASALDQAI